MENIKPISLVALVVMTIVSFTNLFGLNLAGTAVVIGVVFFFINKFIEKQPFKNSGLDLGAIGTNLKDKEIWFWLALPLIMDLVSMGIGKLFLPEYIESEITRVDNFVSLENIPFMIFQLLFLALGEEIAWRAFFQKQLSRLWSITPVLLISSILFSLGHWIDGDSVVMVYSVFFVFVNSLLYGIIFHKTNNAWISGISHFAANLFSVIILVFL